MASSRRLRASREPGIGGARPGVSESAQDAPASGREEATPGSAPSGTESGLGGEGDMAGNEARTATSAPSNSSRNCPESGRHLRATVPGHRAPSVGVDADAGERHVGRELAAQRRPDAPHVPGRDAGVEQSLGGAEQDQVLEVEDQAAVRRRGGARSGRRERRSAPWPRWSRGSAPHRASRSASSRPCLRTPCACAPRGRPCRQLAAGDLLLAHLGRRLGALGLHRRLLLAAPCPPRRRRRGASPGSA